MRTRVAVALVLIIGLFGITLVFAQGKEGFKPGSEPDGFRGIKWGTHVNETKGLEYKDTLKDGRKVYIKTGGKMQIGAAQLDAVFYMFRDDKFYNVFVATNRGYCGELQAAIVSSFGEGYRESARKIQFRGKITWMDYSCEDDRGKLNLTSFKQLEQDIEQKKKAQGEPTQRDVKDDF
jgi:hypothetical protein